METDGEGRPELEEKLSELEILRQSLDEAKTKEKEVFDQFLRLSAEFQTFRRRSETRLIEARRQGQEEILLKIITLADALSQAETVSQKATDVETLRKGLLLVKEQFEKFLSEQGLVPIQTKGEKLDPLRHEAITRVETSELEDGLIVEEIQKGYMLKDRVVRPARVSVSSQPQEMAQAQINQINEEENHV